MLPPEGPLLESRPRFLAEGCEGGPGALWGVGSQFQAWGVMVCLILMLVHRVIEWRLKRAWMAWQKQGAVMPILLLRKLRSRVMILGFV